ncbi:hypothetical protein SAMN05518672_1011515 [Chitinophaga sp. CF118]|nr:hypothetical protein SAMN05518672_1011515 [Chitinophaga sp. CF118]
MKTNYGLKLIVTFVILGKNRAGELRERADLNY